MSFPGGGVTMRPHPPDVQRHTVQAAWGEAGSICPCEQDTLASALCDGPPCRNMNSKHEAERGHWGPLHQGFGNEFPAFRSTRFFAILEQGF